MVENEPTGPSGMNKPLTEDQIAASTVGLLQPLNGTIYLAPYDPA
jgi:hypothetical protein